MSVNLNELDQQAREKIRPGAPLVERHLKALAAMVKIDSRSFNVNEFEGDRETPSDMQEILACAEAYLRGIGFPTVRINRPKPGPVRSTPILMAEIFASREKPTVLFYAHLDKQPYMDDGRFLQWDGVPPTELRWNEDKSRAFGRGAADDLSGVVAIGMAVEALLSCLGLVPGGPPEQFAALPCNIKVIYETEEESGSHTLVEQILDNRDFFTGTDCVIITDVINPAQGVPGLTTSLRGIVQLTACLRPRNGSARLDAQTALYKTLASLIDEDHRIAIRGIDDTPVTEEERKGYSQVPTTVRQLRESAGLLPETRLTVPEDTASLLIAQLRQSYVNCRPGHRVAGGVVFGAAGARLIFPGSPKNPGELQKCLENFIQAHNRFGLRLSVNAAEDERQGLAFDLVVRAAVKDPHSGVHGGPFPIAELLLARFIDRLVADDGALAAELEPWADASAEGPALSTRSLRVENDGTARPFSESLAKAVVEVRLAPGNDETKAGEGLIRHLKDHTPAGFAIDLQLEKGASPWSTPITHPVYPLIMQALEKGYGQTACLYGCGGSIPFVPKLMDALKGGLPICLGPYDPDSRMHEPGESLSMPDLLGCTRSIIHFITRVREAFTEKR